MKKFLCLLLVLAMTSVATAGTAWFEVLSPLKESYLPSDYIEIGIMVDQAATAVTLGAFVSDNGGVAQGPWTLSPNFNLLPNPGVPVNDGTILIELMSGNVNFGSPAVPAGAIATMVFHVPELESSTYITLDDLVDMAHQPFPYSTNVMFDDYSSVADIGELVIHVIPEPMTIALLGMGGLFLLRRRK